MERVELLKQLHDIFIDVLDPEDETLAIEESTQAKDIEEWDSLTHIQLVVAIDKHFNIRFTAQEIRSWNSVGDIINCIEKRLS